MAIVLTFRGILTLTGALHIGSGGGNAHTDATIVRDSRGNPYIPGSSMRGVFRTAVERIAVPVLELEVVRESMVLDRYFEEQHIDLQRSDEALTTFLSGHLNTMERLFGTTYWASPLSFPDMPLAPEIAALTEIRHGVGIDRDTGAASDQIKYDFEVLSRGQRFAFMMRCELDNYYEHQWKQLLAIGLRLLQQGELSLGGLAARGIGQVQLSNLEVFELNMASKADLLEALRSTDSNGHDGHRIAGEEWPLNILQEVA